MREKIANPNPEGFVYHNGGYIAGSTPKTITIETWLLDSRGYAFIVKTKVRRSTVLLASEVRATDE